MNTEVVSRVVKAGLEEVTVSISTGAKPKHFEEQEALSPDGKRMLRVTQWGAGKRGSTYVPVEFPTATCPVYCLRDIYPDVKAFWKDNFTIVIETKKEYVANEQNKQVRSFNDAISIEYVKH